MSLLNGKWTGPIIDNHFHLNRNGKFLNAAEDFKKSGGTGLILVHCPNFKSPPITAIGHRKAYSDTISMAEQVRKSLDLDVRVVLGPHPAAFAHQFELWFSKHGDKGTQRAIENYNDSIDIAIDFCNEGQAVAIGEVGRPHWNAPDEVVELSNQLLEQTMELSRREKIPLQLHMEDNGSKTYSDLESMADRAGLNPKYLVRHFASPDVSTSMVGKITPSVNLGKDGIQKLIETYDSSHHGFMLETDYMDDPRRPGAVLGPKTVPKRTQKLASLADEIGMDEEVFFSIHQDLPNMIYGE
tara:strand:- start:9980 stop:10873 length:894 start_codon:yes stop_codon:yes gene_type:complete